MNRFLLPEELAFVSLWYHNRYNITYNPGQNIWSKIEKSSKTGQDKKRLVSTFARFLTAIAKV